jgi:hypothetical protein
VVLTGHTPSLRDQGCGILWDNGNGRNYRVLVARPKDKGASPGRYGVEQTIRIQGGPQMMKAQRIGEEKLLKEEKWFAAADEQYARFCSGSARTRLQV